MNFERLITPSIPSIAPYMRSSDLVKFKANFG